MNVNEREGGRERGRERRLKFNPTHTTINTYYTNQRGSSFTGKMSEKRKERLEAETSLCVRVCARG